MKKLHIISFCLLFLAKLSAQNTASFSPKIAKGNKITIKTTTFTDESAKPSLAAMGVTADSMVTTTLWNVVGEENDELKFKVEYSMDDNSQKVLALMGPKGGIKLPNYNFSAKKTGIFSQIDNPSELAANYRNMMTEMFKGMSEKMGKKGEKDGEKPSDDKGEDSGEGGEALEKGMTEMFEMIAEMTKEMFSDDMLVSTAVVEVKNILQFGGETLEKGKKYEKSTLGAAEMMPFGVTGKMSYTLESLDAAKQTAQINCEQVMNKDSLINGMMKLVERSMGVATKMAAKSGKPMPSDEEMKQSMDGVRETFANMDIAINSVYTMNLKTGLPQDITQTVVVKGLGEAGEKVTMKRYSIEIE